MACISGLPPKVVSLGLRCGNRPTATLIRRFCFVLRPEQSRSLQRRRDLLCLEIHCKRALLIFTPPSASCDSGTSRCVPRVHLRLELVPVFQRQCALRCRRAPISSTRRFRFGNFSQASSPSTSASAAPSPRHPCRRSCSCRPACISLRQTRVEDAVMSPRLVVVAIDRVFDLLRRVVRKWTDWPE